MAGYDHDIVIVGGGLIGASLACALEPLGLDIALIEAVPFRSDAQPSYDEKTLSLAPASKRILDALGVWPAIESHGMTPIEHILISDRGHFGKTRLSAAEFNMSALGYVVPARVIGLSLVQRISDSHAASLHCPARVTAIETDDEGVSVSLDTRGEPLRARVAVLADGGASATRDMLGIASTTRDYGQTAILCTVTPEAPMANTAFERFTSTGPLALLPTTNNRYGAVWTARNDQVERILGYSDPDFLDRLQERFGNWLGALASPGRRRAYPLKLIEVPDPVRRRAVVIGNAAHTIHPVAGQGFNLGLRDAAVLAEVLAIHWKRDRDIGRSAVLDQYRDWRRRDIRNTTRFTDGLIRIFANDLGPLIAGRNIALAALNHFPPGKRFLVQRTMGLSGRLPRLSRGLPLSP